MLRPCRALEVLPNGFPVTPKKIRCQFVLQSGKFELAVFLILCGGAELCRRSPAQMAGFAVYQEERFLAWFLIDSMQVC